mmetsp:Transcript_89297/g.199714  ORF Transcript_89297/g.199714 Transcript_89297/m.199714 type:complete len:108 (+) Transcript_89297:135-458(+)
MALTWVMPVSGLAALAQLLGHQVPFLRLPRAQQQPPLVFFLEESFFEDEVFFEDFFSFLSAVDAVVVVAVVGAVVAAVEVVAAGTTGSVGAGMVIAGATISVTGMTI